ncbi:MAG TPA: hypothetical protein VLG12_05630 [Candidatus Saccharimonadales bacterium]|nr:hypothetical protein [Candidatus Saccharimonadales bacterium]
MNRQTKRTFTIFGLLLVVVALPGIVLLSRNQQTFQQSAHVPQPTATAVCQGSTVIVSSSYIITGVSTGVSCNITAVDSQQFLNDSFSTKLGDPAHTKTVDTHKNTISPGVITFQTTCADNFKKTDQAAYSLTTPCVSPTTSPTITPKPSATPTPSICQANKSVCSWSADSSAVSYHYEVLDANNTLVLAGDVQAPQTSVQFPSIIGGSYKCNISGVNACGTGQPGTGQFVCLSPTPSLCVTLPAPQHVKVSCPNCSQ